LQPPGEPFTLKDARKLYSGALIGNCGYTQETAEAAIASGDADMIAFGRPYIANPDLVDRFSNGWPLADAPDMSVWYGGGAAGYTDFPAYKP
jgi:N-ethylmaleimide reductase